MQEYLEGSRKPWDSWIKEQTNAAGRSAVPPTVPLSPPLPVSPPIPSAPRMGPTQMDAVNLPMPSRGELTPLAGGLPRVNKRGITML